MQVPAVSNPRSSPAPRASHAALPAWALALCLALAMALLGPTAKADEVDALQPGLASQVRQMAQDASASAPAGAGRIEVTLGRLDGRLRLAPCARVEPYLPAGTVLWGKSRIGLRCTQGSSAWNAFMPITVSVFGKAWVAATPLAAGRVLDAADLVQAEVNLAESASPPVTDPARALGRALGRALPAGQALRQADLKPRQWFAAGDEVRVTAVGNGFSVAGTGQALSHGLEGQPARVRIDSGRIVVGLPVGERQMELPL